LAASDPEMLIVVLLNTRIAHTLFASARMVHAATVKPHRGVS